ncbi:MAG TPA: hypothetical protein VKF60_15425 [Myxococcota bacterium]|nr:hypothetical protein [Myxococcota bacterium]
MTAISMASLLALGAGAYALRKSPPLRAAASTGTARQAQRAVVEDCNQYAALARRDTGRIVRDGAVGGAVGAGVGAAGGAIADGGKGAGKGAGIGALVGATIGALRGLNEENQKSEAARTAYADCLARRGY